MIKLTFHFNLNTLWIPQYRKFPFQIDFVMNNQAWPDKQFQDFPKGGWGTAGILLGTFGRQRHGSVRKFRGELSSILMCNCHHHMGKFIAMRCNLVQPIYIYNITGWKLEDIATGTDILMRSFRLKHPRWATYLLDQSKDSDVTSNQHLDQSAAWKVTSRAGDLSVLITLGWF